MALKFLKISRIDCVEMFTPTVKTKSLQIYLDICVFFESIIHQINIVRAYLESLLDNNKYPIYMKPPPSIGQMRKKLHCRFLRTLYNFK